MGHYTTFTLLCDGMMPIGVRGPARQQRFAAFLPVAEIAFRLTGPE
jgi:hypothetical protein